MAKKLGVIIARYVHSSKTDQVTNRTVENVFKVADPVLDTSVYLVDNGSSIPFKSQAEKLTYTKWNDNKGIAAAWNEGWRQAFGADFLCFLNADCIVEPGWDKALCIAAEQLNCIAMPYTNGEKSDGVGVTGWCFLTSRATANRIGLFDEAFSPAYYEDTDWFQRAIDNGIALVNIPTANVQHVRGQGGSEDAPWHKRKGLIHLSNRYRWAWKHDKDPAKPPAFWQHPLPEVEFDDVSS